MKTVLLAICLVAVGVCIADPNDVVVATDPNMVEVKLFIDIDNLLPVLEKVAGSRIDMNAYNNEFNVKWDYIIQERGPSETDTLFANRFVIENLRAIIQMMVLEIERERYEAEVKKNTPAKPNVPDDIVREVTAVER